MNEQKRIVLNKIDKLLGKRRAELLKELPSIHEIDDGIIVRFFTEWDACEDDTGIKYKKIKNNDNPDESIVLFFIPEGAFFDLKQRYYIGCITCLNGGIDITINNNTKFLESGYKICIDSDEVQGLALKNTYIVTTSDRKKWSETTQKHVEQSY
jgi:hypothetical protein